MGRQTKLVVVVQPKPPVSTRQPCSIIHQPYLVTQITVSATQQQRAPPNNRDKDSFAWPTLPACRAQCIPYIRVNIMDQPNPFTHAIIVHVHMTPMPSSMSCRHFGFMPVTSLGFHHHIHLFHMQFPYISTFFLFLFLVTCMFWEESLVCSSLSPIFMKLVREDNFEIFMIFKQ